MKIMQKKIVHDGKKVFFGPRVHCNTRSKRNAIISIFKLQLQLQLLTKINQSTYPTHLINLSIVETTGVQCALV